MSIEIPRSFVGGTLAAMSEFLNLVPPPEALARLLARLNPVVQVEIERTENALGRVLAADIIAGQPLPPFKRSTVDGFAVRAADTHGAGASLPAYLSCVGEVAMGGAAERSLAPGECVIIHTGGMLPENADAVVMVEDTQAAAAGEIEIYRALAAGDNVLQTGEDVRPGETVLTRGSRIRAAEIGGLMALGYTSVEVARRPRVAILSSGDEVVSPEDEPGPGQVRDVNSYALQALVREAGGEPLLFGILPDRIDAFRSAARRALDEAEIVVFTAGSSVSVRDLTAQVIDELGEPGVLVHGVSVRPGKPTILAVCGGRPVIGLPGNPVSALVIAGLFVRPVIHGYLGVSAAPAPVRTARLTTNLASQAGREDWVPVRLVQEGGVWLAEPVFGKSNLIFTLARADGLIRIPAAANGLAAGAAVEVALF